MTRILRSVLRRLVRRGRPNRQEMSEHERFEELRKR
jgi:hypothetical protein